MNVFETERLIVRHYTHADEESFFLLNGDPEVMRYIRPAKTREESLAFLGEVIEYSKNNPAFGRMAVFEKATGIFVGSFAIIPLEHTGYMQMGYSLLTSHWGKGFATELVRSGLTYFFSLPDYDEIFGVTELMNIASQHVLLKAGFKPHSQYLEGNKELLRFNLLKQDLKI